MGLPWFRLYSKMPEHPKSDALFAATGDDMAWARVVRLWCWAAENRADGDLSGIPDVMIGVRAGIPTKGAEAFALAMRQCGWIDSDNRLHGWAEEQSAHVKVMERDKKKKQRKRGRLKGLSLAGSPGDSGRDGEGTTPREIPANRPLSTSEMRLESRELRENPNARAGALSGTDPSKTPEAHFEDHPSEDREEPPLWEPPEAVVAPQRKITAPTPDREPVVAPEPSAAPATRWNGGPPVGPRGAPQAVASLKDAYNLLRKTLDSAGTWKEFDFHEGEVIERALRAHPLSAAPSPYDCLTIEVIAGMQADELWRKPNMQRLRVALKDTNLEMAIGTARAKARGYDPSAKPAPAKPAVPKPVYWEPTEVPNATTCPPEARPKFMQRQPETPKEES